MWACSVTNCPTLCDSMGCSPPGSSVHGIPQQEYWRGLPFPPPGDLLNPEIEPRSPALQADSLSTELSGKPYFGLDKNILVGTLVVQWFGPSAFTAGAQVGSLVRELRFCAAKYIYIQIHTYIYLYIYLYIYIWGLPWWSSD